mgnify:CR=1 FL=1
MVSMKMVCLQCPHYDSCPLKTRLFINYCGSKKEELREPIRAARLDCVNRRRFMLKRRLHSLSATKPA